MKKAGSMLCAYFCIDRKIDLDETFLTVTLTKRHARVVMYKYN